MLRNKKKIGACTNNVGFRWDGHIIIFVNNTDTVLNWSSIM